MLISEHNNSYIYYRSSNPNSTTSRCDVSLMLQMVTSVTILMRQYSEKAIFFIRDIITLKWSSFDQFTE